LFSIFCTRVWPFSSRAASFLVSALGLLALLDAPLLVGLPLVDARRAAGLRKGGQRERRECGGRDEINEFYASSPYWWLLRDA
jgi:hypothetical protein